MKENVFLKEDKVEGWPRELATILDYDPRTKTYIVQIVDPQDPEDDGIREVTSDQIESS